MLLVVFGAGASYDSVPHLPPGGILPAVRPAMVDNHPENTRPPLASQLFDTRPLFVEAMRRFRECLEVIPLLRKPDVLVERELAELREQAKQFPRVHQELAAILFYLHFAIWESQRFWFDCHQGINNYVTFVRELERWRFESNENICFVTFNYDTMLEQAMEQVLHIAFTDFSQYVSQNNYILVKLHGSMNWGRELDGIRPASPQELIDAAANLRISDRFRFVARHPMILDDGSIAYPALSIPLEKKDEFSCPESHVDSLIQILAKMTKIISIGWRAMEEDFREMLRLSLPPAQEVLIVSGDERGGNETLENLKRGQNAFLSETIVPTYGFTGLINNLGYLNNFLRRPNPRRNRP